MTKPTQERIDRAAEVIIPAVVRAFSVKGMVDRETAIAFRGNHKIVMDALNAALLADDSHLAAENERLRELLRGAEEVLTDVDAYYGEDSDVFYKVRATLTKIRATLDEKAREE